MTSKARTVCDPNCHAKPKCGLTATIEDGKIIAVDPADYPVPGYENRICLMGRARLEYQYHADRLRSPMKRVGARGEGHWEVISWEEAVALFVAEQRRIIDQYGSRAVAFSQVSGAYGLLTRGAPLRYAALTGGTSIRASGVDYGLAKGLEYTFGVPAGTFFAGAGHSLTDAENSDLTIIWGNNPAVTRSVDHVALKRARASGTRLVCIDPIRSETAGWSDEWISLRPGSDAALALSMAHVIITNDLHDRHFLVDHSNLPFLVDRMDGRHLRVADIVPDGGDAFVVWCDDAQAPVPVSEATSPALDFEGEVQRASGGIIESASAFKLLEQLVGEFPPAVAAEVTDVPASVIESLALAYGSAERAALRIGYGIDRWYNADLTARAVALLACLTGMIGVSGGGISLVSGDKGVPVRGSRFYAPGGKLPHFLSMMEADDAVQTGSPYPIKMECISLGNPFNQVKPNRNKVIDRYVGGLEFIAVIDHFMTDTAKWADLVLPACTIFERNDVVVDTFVQLQQRVVEPEGEAKSDFEIFQAFAEAFGVGNHFDRTANEYIDDILRHSPSLDEADIRRLKRDKVIYPWRSSEPYVGLADRKFATPSGRVEIYKENLLAHDAELPFFREPVEASPKNPLFETYPLVLLSSHSRYRIHSTFANLETVKRREGEPVVRVHPRDAEQRGIEDGSIVEIFNGRGRVKIRVRFDDALRPGCLLIGEGHWVDQFIEGDPYGLTHDAFSVTAENYAHYDVLVEMRAARTPRDQFA